MHSNPKHYESHTRSKKTPRPAASRSRRWKPLPNGAVDKSLIGPVRGASFLPHTDLPAIPEDETGVRVAELERNTFRCRWSLSETDEDVPELPATIPASYVARAT